MPGLYLHIPFCARKCLYCDFYSVATTAGPGEARLLTRDNPDFLNALEEELKNLPASFAPETIFIGGGTPTELSECDFRNLFVLIHRHVSFRHVAEWTCESNPGTLTGSKAHIMKDAGVDRVSLGVQSFDPVTLAFLGRIHTAAEAVGGFGLLRSCGFANINLDLMHGVPGVSVESVRRDIEQLVELNPEHAACYSLIFEEGTPLTNLRDKGLVREASEESQLNQYHAVRTLLTAAGYRHCEISNFARPGRECRHNMLYWGDGEYIGCGPSAHSHWEGCRYANVRDVGTYTARLLEGQSPRDFEERLEPEAKARETLIMGLRRLDGVDRAVFQASTGFDYRHLCGDRVRWLCDEGLLEETGGRLRLTGKGLFVSDSVFAELV